MTIREIYTRLKRLIAEKKNKKPSEILAAQLLRNQLRFTSQGLRALCVDINELYQDVEVTMHPDQTEKAKTVRDLAWSIWELVPSDYKN